MMSQNQCACRLDRGRVVGSMLVIVLSIGLLAATGCNERSSGSHRYDSPPSPPEQEVVLQDYSHETTETLNSISELNKLKQTIRMDLSSWKRARSSKSGPSFGGEANALGSKIVQRCDELESGANDLLTSAIVDAPQSRDLKNMVKFAKETRETVEGTTDDY